MSDFSWNITFGGRTLTIKTRQWLMERLNSEEFGLRQFLDMTQSWENASDEDLIAGFRAAAEKAGLTAEDLVQWLEGLKRDRIYAP